MCAEREAVASFAVIFRKSFTLADLSAAIGTLVLCEHLSSGARPSPRAR
jgi:hypothetical protein